MIETCCLENVVIFVQTILIFVVSRKIISDVYSIPGDEIKNLGRNMMLVVRQPKKS